MTARLLAMSLGCAAALAFGGAARAQTPEKADATKADSSKADPSNADDSKAVSKKADAKKAGPRPPRTETATFGGGCFWCTEAVFERVPGVKSVVSGFSGGLVPNPTYQMVLTGETGHAEVVQIEFDPDKVSFEDLLHIFFKTHDPTTPNAQGPDFGTQYRSVIFFHGEEQKKAALKVNQEMKAKRMFRSPVVTELVPFVAFYPAEMYHQDYFRNHPYEDYSQAYIVPKVRKLRSMLAAPAAKAAAKGPAAK
ncbi:MAG TPA: peptide-methionine (S)-S-oxide reductase MsrA [Isosphaeraceae bacterium]|jgi:peptide-methionine (S)-S-oxide reductase